MARTNQYGRLHQIYSNATLTAPASKTDETKGALLTGSPLDLRGTAMASHHIILESALGDVLQNVQIGVFQDGFWRYLAVVPSGQVLFSSLTLTAGFPVQFLIKDIGNPKRIVIVATHTNPVDAFIQAAERS